MNISDQNAIISPGLLMTVRRAIVKPRGEADAALV
jgi:hypothetical protein